MTTETQLHESVRIVCAGKPQAWERSGKSGKQHFTPAKTANYQAYIKHEARQVMKSRPPLDVPVSVNLLATFPIPKSWPKYKREAAHYVTTKPDADNVIKSALDAMNEIVYRDDALVVDVFLQKRYGEVPGLQITVQPMPLRARVAA